MKEKTAWQELRGTFLFSLACLVVIFATDMDEFEEITLLRVFINISYTIIGGVMGALVGYCLKK